MACWKIHHLWMIFQLKPPFLEDFPLHVWIPEGKWLGQPTWPHYQFNPCQVTNVSVTGDRLERKSEARVQNRCTLGDSGIHMFPLVHTWVCLKIWYTSNPIYSLSLSCQWCMVSPIFQTQPYVWGWLYASFSYAIQRSPPCVLFVPPGALPDIPKSRWFGEERWSQRIRCTWAMFKIYWLIYSL